MKLLYSALAVGLVVLGQVGCGTATASAPHRHHARAVRAAQPCYWASPDGHVYVQVIPGPHVPRNAICGQAQPYLAWPGDGGKIWPSARSLPTRNYITVCSVTSPYGYWTVLSDVRRNAQARAACSLVESSRLP